MWTHRTLSGVGEAVGVGRWGDWGQGRLIEEDGKGGWGEVEGGWARGGGVEPESKTTILESIERLGVLEHEKSI